MIDKLKILNISYSLQGGAGVSALNFHNLLKSNGLESYILAYKGTEGLSSNHILTINITLFNLILKTFKIYFLRYYYKINRLKSNDKYSFLNYTETIDTFIIKDISLSIPFKPDIIILHWVTGLINSKQIALLRKLYNCKIIWRFNDFAPFTGGCHYINDCEKYKDECGKCPALNSTKLMDLTNKQLQFKLRYLKNIVTYISTTSEIHNQIVSSRIIQQNKLVKIFPSLNNNYTHSFSNELYNSSFKIMVVATSFSEKRKGFEYIYEILNFNFITTKKIEFILVTKDKFLPIDISHIKYNYSNYYNLNSSSLAKLYIKSNLFISTSIQDAGPLTICESISYGTPVVCFDIGIAKDIIHNNITGYRIENFNLTDMINNISKIINMEEMEYKQLRDSTYNFAKVFFDPQKEFNAYCNLFNNLI